MSNNDVAWAPLPGIAVEYKEACSIIQCFRAAFRHHTTGRPENIPTWCTFPVGAQLQWSDFYAVIKRLASREGVYFYQEGGTIEKLALHRATASEITTFFKTRQPWQDKDYYIFDTTMTFCIAVTHDDDIIHIEV